MKAALNGHTVAVEHLLASNALLDLEDKGGYTALMLALAGPPMPYSPAPTG